MLIAKHISSENLEDLEKFLSVNPEGLKKFRYYNKREHTCVSNHLVTYLFYFDNEIVGYGHLDEEKDRIWLGIMVSDTQVGKGYGKEIMKKLLSDCNQDIFLSVDKDNISAIKLYQLFGFYIIEETINYHIMKKNYG